MTSPRTPRQWNAGSEEPPVGVDSLVDPLGFEMVRHQDGLWRYAGSEDGFPWIDLDDEFAVEWPLSEVLPETPEPPQVLAPRATMAMHAKYYRDEDGDQQEGACWCRIQEDHWQQDPVPASQSVPAVPVSSTGGKETGEGDEGAQGADEPDYVTVPVTPQYVATRGIANIIDEHFGDDYEEAAWAAAEEIVRHGYAYPRLRSPITREELGRRVSEVALKWSREQDDRPGATATWEQLADEFQELHMRVGEAMFGLGMTFSPAPRSLPDSETEPDAMQWGYREHAGEDVDPVREEYARFRAQDEHLKLVQREVRFGPWIEVTS